MSDAWSRILAHPAWRGELAGYTGTTVLEEVDEDERVARLRFQGTRGGATATARITAVGQRSGEVELRAEVHPGHGSDLTADQLTGAVKEVWAPRDDRRLAQPAATAGRARRPGPRRALVAAGAAAALAAWALKGRR